MPSLMVAWSAFEDENIAEADVEILFDGPDGDVAVDAYCPQIRGDFPIPFIRTLRQGADRENEDCEK